ncbi:MAG: flagellar protein [Clostridium sp.]|nr:flagellar protein [Acetatifactor muris]MCM1526148.1 hypothetical protein [Bacteroides sp.]MCM1562704.1 flagellar protein [Clostridium sp.]
MEKVGLLDAYHTPLVCKECGGRMIFKGVGEYHCEDCGYVDYDDYGKVRQYLEEHPGANAVEVEEHTGVQQKIIRQMLREARIQVAEGSQSFLHCELCGKGIRYGKFCPECEKKFNKSAEEHQQRVKNLQGYGKNQKSEDGQRRFMRDDD